MPSVELFGCFYVDMKVIGDYEPSHQIAMLKYDSSGLKKVEEIYNEAMKSGKFKLEGDSSKGPEFLRPLHNLLAERTI